MRKRILALALLLAAPAGAQSFDIRLGGATVGAVEVAAQSAGRAYRADVHVTTGGLAAALKRVDVRLAAQGRVHRGTLIPETSAFEGRIGRKAEAWQMLWTDGTPGPRLPRGEARPSDAPPEDQAGTLDLASALWLLLRDQTGPLCTQALETFDGVHRGRLTLAPAGEGRCDGAYERVAGFSPREMAERRRFALRLSYDPQGDAWRLMRLEMETLFGAASLVRR